MRRSSTTHGGRRSRRIARAIAVTLGTGIIFCWAFVFLVLPAIHLGLSERAADRIPLAGLVIGMLVGWGAQRYEQLHQAVISASAPLLFGAVFWFLGVALGAFLLLVGVPQGLVDLVPPTGFVSGLLLGLLPLYAWVMDLRKGPEAR